MTHLPPMCLWCKHYDRETEEGMVCTAFPKGIPPAILENRFDHRQPWPAGDGGVTFEADEQYTPAYFGFRGSMSEHMPKPGANDTREKIEGVDL